MRAYENEQGTLDIYYNEPDETMTIEQYQAVLAEQEKQARIAELKEVIEKAQAQLMTLLPIQTPAEIAKDESKPEEEKQADPEGEEKQANPAAPTVCRLFMAVRWTTPNQP